MSAVECSRFPLANANYMEELNRIVNRAKNKLAAAMSFFNEVVEFDAVDRAIDLLNQAERELNDAIKQYEETAKRMRHNTANDPSSPHGQSA